TARSPWRTPTIEPLGARQLTRFNGATARSPWRTSKASARPDGSRQLQWGHGSLAVENATVVVEIAEEMELQCGHGSRAVENQRHPGTFWTASVMLQWGHGSLAVENGTVEGQGPPLLAASMGPRLARRGERGPCGPAPW